MKKLSEQRTFTKEEAASRVGKRVRTTTTWLSGRRETGTVTDFRQQHGGRREWEVLIEWDDMAEVKSDGTRVRRHMGVATKENYVKHLVEIEAQ